MARPKDPHSRASLMAAARREFVNAGIKSARIEDITQACGLSKGAFYLHFGSKEALFRELVGELQEAFETLRVAREEAYGALIGRGLPSRRGNPGPFIAALAEIDGREDRRLLEMMWEWRDVTDVLLRGSQGTEFEGVMWAMLDHEVARVATECEPLKQAGLMRDDVSADVLGMMIVGTYLLVARSLSTLTQKPDFEPMVKALQTLITDGTASPSLRAHRDARPKTRRRPPSPAVRRSRR